MAGLLPTPRELTPARFEDIEARLRRLERVRNYAGGGGVQTYTAHVSQSSGATSIGSETFRYALVGDLVVVIGGVSVTGTGTSGQPVRVTLPVLPSPTSQPAGMFSIYDASTNLTWNGRAGVIDDGGGPPAFVFGVANGQSNYAMGQTGSPADSPFTEALVSPDSVRVNVIYFA